MIFFGLIAGVRSADLSTTPHGIGCLVAIADSCGHRLVIMCENVQLQLQGPHHSPDDHCILRVRLKPKRNMKNDIGGRKGEGRLRMRGLGMVRKASFGEGSARAVEVDETSGCRRRETWELWRLIQYWQVAGRHIPEWMATPIHYPSAEERRCYREGMRREEGRVSRSLRVSSLGSELGSHSSYLVS